MENVPRPVRRFRFPKTALLLAMAAGCGVTLFGGYSYGTRINFNREHQVGDRIDSLNGVTIYFNGGVNNVVERNLSADGYNLGLRYQCVEFVKRYYYERFGHRMPDAYGHAKDFFDTAVPDGALSVRRGLVQYVNGTPFGSPQPDDIVVFGPSLFNPYGHVAIVATAGLDSIKIAQQNPGPFAPSRESLPLRRDGSSGWSVAHPQVRGWLRRPASSRA
jgi:surface antigen